MYFIKYLEVTLHKHGGGGPTQQKTKPSLTNQGGGGVQQQKKKNPHKVLKFVLVFSVFLQIRI